MKQFAILVYPKKPTYIGMFQRRDGQSGRVWVSRSGEKYEFFERIDEATTTFYFDDEATRTEMLNWLKEEYPGRTYMLVKTEEVHYADITPYQVGQFTEKGFLPK